MSMQSVMAEVAQERKRQDEKWGIQHHHPFEWLAILAEEVGEANRGALESHFGGILPHTGWHSYRKELIHAAAVAVAMVECHDKLLVKNEPANAAPGCEVCGCTEDHACGNGCSWDPLFKKAGRDVCSNCVGKAKPITKVKPTKKGST